MAELTAGFETGVDENDILTSDTGDADAWQVSVVSDIGERKYDSARAKFGSLSYRNVSGGTSSTTGTGVGWSTAGGMDTATDHYGRAYIYMTAAPSAGRVIVRCARETTRNCQIAVSITDGFVQLLDKTVQMAIGAVPISLNQWVRLEWHMIHSATVGQMEAKLFNNADSTIPSETITSAASFDTGTAAGGIYFGSVGNTPDGHSVWWDAIVANAASYPGPVPIPPATLSTVPSPLRW